MSGDCLFCGVVAGEVDSEVVYEDDHVVAFRDVNPQAPTHLLVVPRDHVGDWQDLADERADLSGPLVRGVAAVARREGLEDYRVVANRGAEAGQSVFHLHLHVLGGRSLGWPPG